MVTTEPAPLISVVTPAFNCEAYLPRCINSVRLQTLGEWELLVVDDGSSDRTFEVARSATMNDRRIRALRHPDGGNHGVSAARNLALGAARGTYVAFLDADDSWFPKLLERQIEVLSRESRLTLSYAQASCVDAADAPLCHPDWPHLRWVIGHAPAAGLVEHAFGGFLSTAVGIPVVTTAAPRRSVLDIGGFVEDLQYQVEDAVLLARLCRVGAVHFTEEILARYRVHPENFTATLTPLTSVDSVWELYLQLAVGRDTLEPELAATMLRCIDRYLTTRNVPWRNRLRRAREVARVLLDRGIATPAGIRSRFIAAWPLHFKREMMIGLRRHTRIGPTPWRSRGRT
jgi:glycosyltransferase involved in cell wall biosynthesis